MARESAMLYEHFYHAAFCLARRTKKQYLTKALAREESAHLGNIGLNGWELQERKEVYRQEVRPYWRKLGKVKVPKRFWFELFGSRDHRMDPRFIPADLLYTEILPYMNDGLQRPGLVNKGYLEYLFHDVKQPGTVALKIGGIYCDADRNPIREEEAVELCLRQDGPLFLKASVDASGGRGIYMLDPSGDAGTSGATGTTGASLEDVRKIFREAGASFIVQEGIRQHPALRSLNPSSVSTIRIISLLMEDKVYIESAAIRISAPDTSFMKIYNGGVSAQILEDGSLYPKVYSDLGKWYDQGKGLFDDHFRIPFMDRIYDEVKRIHPRMAHFRCIGWDFALDEQGNPVLIEPNVFPGIGCAQITPCRPIFGEQTDWVLEDYFLHRTWAENHRQGVLIQ